MDIRSIRYFVQIVESGSLSRAARELHVAQPALSQQIAKLEADVGKPLLNRSPKGVSPTDNGLALYHHAQFMLRQFDQTIPIARSEQAALQGMVSVGLPATTVAALGLPLVRRVRKNHPGILLNIVEGMSGHIRHMMRAGQFDLAVQFSDDLISEFTIEGLLSEELYVILPADSRLVDPGKESISIADAAQLPFILPTGGHGLRQRIAAEFASRDLHLNVVGEIDSLALVMECVNDGIGATIKPMGAVMHGNCRSLNWRCLSFSDVKFRRRNFLYSVPGERLSVAASAVITELKIAADELVDDAARPGFEPLHTVEDEPALGMPAWT